MKKFYVLSVGIVCMLLISLQSVSLRFSGGEGYTFYCGSTSSLAQIITCSTRAAVFYKLLLGAEITGESTVYTNKEPLSLIEEQGAKLLFVEEVAGIKNYYCHQTGKSRGVDINGYSVNLHVAVREDGTVAIGSPLIFGGF